MQMQWLIYLNSYSNTLIADLFDCLSMLVGCYKIQNKRLTAFLFHKVATVAIKHFSMRKINACLKGIIQVDTLESQILQVTLNLLSFGRLEKPYGIFVAKLQQATAEQVNHIMVIQYENNGLQGETQAYQHQNRDPIEIRQSPR